MSRHSSTQSAILLMSSKVSFNMLCIKTEYLIFMYFKYICIIYVVYIGANICFVSVIYVMIYHSSTGAGEGYLGLFPKNATGLTG